MPRRSGDSITWRTMLSWMPGKRLNIVNISQCLTGSVEMERYGAGFQLKTAHVISGHDSTVEAMVTKMMYLQGRFDDNRKVREMLKQSLAGEITV